MGCFWQTTIAMKGYAQVLKIISGPGEDQDRLICPLHETAGLLGTYKKKIEKSAALLFCQHYIDLCTANTVPADFT